MKPWIRLTLVLMTVGGGFAGFLGTLQFSSGTSGVKLLFALLFAVLYAFVTAAGLLFVHDPLKTGPLLVALAMQVPSISSSLIVYRFAVGLELITRIGKSETADTAGVSFGWYGAIGTFWKFALSQENPLYLGINVVPLALLLLLLRARQSSLKTMTEGPESVAKPRATQTP